MSTQGRLVGPKQSKLEVNSPPNEPYDELARLIKRVRESKPPKFSGNEYSSYESNGLDL